MLKQRVRCRWHIASFVILIGGLSACGTTVKSTSTGVEMSVLGTEKINGKEIESFDLTGDKKANIWNVFRLEMKDGKERRGRLVEKRLDPNFDGRPDVITYYNGAGRRAKESMDLDFDGSIDAISFYEGGELVRRHIDLDFDGKMDVVKFYSKGKLVRKERDKDNNGRAEVWEYFQDDRLVRVGLDKDGDGEPETFQDAPTSSDDDEEQKAPPPPAEKEKAPPVEKSDKGDVNA